MIEDRMKMDYKVRCFLKMDYIPQYLLKMIYLFFDETDACYASGDRHYMNVAGDYDYDYDYDYDDEYYVNYVNVQCDDLMLCEYAF